MDSRLWSMVDLLILLLDLHWYFPTVIKLKYGELLVKNIWENPIWSGQKKKKKPKFLIYFLPIGTARLQCSLETEMQFYVLNKEFSWQQISIPKSAASLSRSWREVSNQPVDLVLKVLLLHCIILLLLLLLLHFSASCDVTEEDCALTLESRAWPSLSVKDDTFSGLGAGNNPRSNPWLASYVIQNCYAQWESRLVLWRPAPKSWKT